MSKKVDAVEEPEIVDEEGEESDEYDDIEEEDEDAGVEDDEQEDDDDAGLTEKGSSLTALLLGGTGENDEEDEEDEEDEDEDEEYTPVDVKGPATETIASAPPPAIGTKRTREEDQADNEEDVSGDYGEFEENSESVKKKARAAAEEEV